MVQCAVPCSSRRPPAWSTGASRASAKYSTASSLTGNQAAKARRDEEMQAEIEDFIEGFNQPTYRGMRINGQRVATWSSEHGWSGDGRPEAEWIQGRLITDFSVIRLFDFVRHGSLA